MIRDKIGIRQSMAINNHEKSASPGIRVAMVEPVGGHGGMHFYDFSLCLGLLAVGCCVSLYTCGETADPKIPDLSFHPVYRGVFGRQARWLRGLRYLKSTFVSMRTAKARGETICHYHTFNDPFAEMIVVFVAKLFSRKIVLTVHDVDSLAYHGNGSRSISKWIIRRADRLIVHNMVSKSELEKTGIPPEKISVIPHGHYLEHVGVLPQQALARQALCISPAAKVILFFGQIKDTKGLDLLIDALPRVANEIPEVLLLIAGRPWKSTFAHYETMIDMLKIRRLCQLHIGYVPDEKVPDYYAAADVVTLPYRRIYQSGVLLMAMTFGRPVVVSDLPGMTEVVTDGNNGYVFKEGSSSDLADVLIKSLRDETGRQAIAARALRYIHVSHDWNRIARATADVYRAILFS